MGRLLCFAVCLHILISTDYLFKRLPYLTCNFHLYEVIWLRNFPVGFLWTFTQISFPLVY